MYNSSIFQLKYTFQDNTMALHMQMLLPHVSTGSIPNNVEFLAKNCPGVLKTQCFNEQNLPFFIEVKNTELGHLFEHLLLHQLCSKKISKGHNQAEFKGVTQWDWEKEPYGSFRITINLSREDLKFFTKSLRATITVFEKLVSTIPTPTHQNPARAYSHSYISAN